jgi:hypothetical protein
MKTKLTLTLLALMFSIVQLHADELNFKMQDEAYINDIPFNTTVILNTIHSNCALSADFELMDEPYINDIPFDTLEVAMDIRKNKESLSVRMTEEAYIDDIPFDTQKIAADFLN